MSKACPPGRKMTAAEYARLGPCERLELVEFALFELSAGQKRTQVRLADNWVEYSQGSIPFLTSERARLSALCPKTAGKLARHAITIGRTEYRRY